MQRELQAALIGMSKQYCPGAVPLAGAVCADPQAGTILFRYFFMSVGYIWGKSIA